MSSRAGGRRTKRSPFVRLRVFAFFIIVLVVLAIWGGFALATSSFFRVETVAVTGNNRVTTGQVLTAAHIDPSANAWLLNTADISERLNAIPWVATARVARTLPARVEIVVTERVAAACLEAPRSVTIDSSLRVLSGGCLSPLLAHIALRLKQVPVPGQTVSDERVAQLVRDLTTLAAANIPVRGVSLDTYGSLVARDPDGVDLKFGADGDLASKAKLIRPIRSSSEIHGRALRAIDVRAPQTPVVEYR